MTLASCVATFYEIDPPRIRKKSPRSSPESRIFNYVYVYVHVYLFSLFRVACFKCHPECSVYLYSLVVSFLMSVRLRVHTHLRSVEQCTCIFIIRVGKRLVYTFHFSIGGHIWICGPINDSLCLILTFPLQIFIVIYFSKWYYLRSFKVRLYFQQNDTLLGFWMVNDKVILR